MNFPNKICLLCLENHDELIEIYGKQGIDLNVGAILEEHFWFEVGTFAANKICENCWKNVESFHIFYNFVKAIHQQQTEPRIEQTCETKEIIDYNGLVCSIKEERIDIKVEFDDFTNILDSIENPSPRCEDLDVDSSTARDPPTVPQQRRKYTIKKFGPASAGPLSYKRKTDIYTPLLSQYFNMACDICEKKLLSYRDTKNHYKEVHDSKDGYLICCNTKYVQLRQMLSHCEWHTKQTDSVLSQISASPSTEPAVYKHKSDVYTPLLSQYFNMACDLCETKILSYQDSKKHYREVHDMKNGYLICCNRKYKRLPPMLSHCEWHVNPDAFKCGQCSKTFRDKDMLDKHLNLAHLSETDQIFNCKDCGKNFARLSLLKMHQKSHEPCYKCAICQKRFTGKLNLRHHIREVHSLEDEKEFRRNLKSITKVRAVDPVKEEAKKFECDICGKRFAHLPGVITHIKRVHCNIDRHAKLNICEICAKPYKSRAQYKEHYIKAHTDISEKCQCATCGKWLTNKNCLYKHMRYHTSTPETCKICGRVCKNINSLHGHMSTVHREPSLECTACGKMFKRVLALKEHMAIHTGVTDLYSCGFCTKTFRSNANMYAHRKRAHPTEVKKVMKTKTHF